MGLAEIDSGLKSFEAMYAQTIHEFQSKEIDGIIKDVRNGLEAGDLMGGSGRAVFRYRPILRARLIEIMTRVRNFGRAQVQQELARQKP